MNQPTQQTSQTSDPQNSLPGWIGLAAVGFVCYMMYSANNPNPPSPNPVVPVGVVAVSDKVMVDLADSYASNASAVAIRIRSNDYSSWDELFKDWEQRNQDSLKKSFAPLDEILAKAKAGSIDDVSVAAPILDQIATGFVK